MAIEMIDKQGLPKKVLTDYQPHTISIVGEGALGVNLTKLKSEKAFNKTEEGKALTEKINKAKSLDAAEQEAVVVTELAVVEEQVETVITEDVVEAPVVTPEVETAEVEADVPVVVEDTVAEDTGATEAPADVIADAPTVVVAETAVVVDVATEGVQVNKAKSFTSDELIQAQKDVLDGVHEIVKKVQAALPDADLWKVVDLVHAAVWKVEDAVWDAESSMWNDIYNEVWEETNTRVNKAKALKISETGSFEQKLKALEAIDPVLAEFARTNRAKALEVEAELKATNRAKALDQGAELYKRISTDDNTTENIVDAMLTISVSSPAEHKIIAKALETASTITMAGELFRDIGVSEENQHMDAGTYVASRAKSLVLSEGKDATDSALLAGARATVRQSAEFQAIYG